MALKYHICSQLIVFRPMLTPKDPFWHFWWVVMIPTDPLESALTRSNQDATRYSHLEPPGLLMAKMFDLWRIWNHFKPPRAPLWQFQGIQIVPSDLPGCVPPISNQDPTRSTHSEPTGPLMSGNGYFMEHSGQFPAQQNPPSGNFGGFKWYQQTLLSVSLLNLTNIQQYPAI